VKTLTEYILGLRSNLMHLVAMVGRIDDLFPARNFWKSEESRLSIQL